MRNSATPFFRDVLMPRAANDRYAHERFMLDTLADRRAPEKPRSRFRAFAIRSASLLKFS